MTVATQDVRAVEETEPVQQQDEMAQIVSFTIGGEEYGIDIKQVQEVILIGKITELPQVPHYVRGLINLRGLVIPVVDLRARLGLEMRPFTDESRIIVSNHEDRIVGVLVDAVKEILRFSSDQVEVPPSGIMKSDQQFVSGLIRFEDRILLRLALSNLLTEEDEAQGVGAAEPAETTSKSQSGE